MMSCTQDVEQGHPLAFAVAVALLVPTPRGSNDDLVSSLKVRVGGDPGVTVPEVVVIRTSRVAKTQA